MAEWPGSGELRAWQVEVRDWVRANDDCRRDILDRLPRRRAAADQRAARHLRGALAVQRLEQQPQRPDDARHAGAARRGRRRRRRADATGCGTWPRGSIPTTRCPRWTRRDGCVDERRLRALGIARAKGTKLPSRAGRRRRGRRAGRGRGGPRPVAGRPGPARPAVHRARGAAVAVRPAPRRPQADGRDLRVRLHPRDVQARRRSGGGATTRCRSCTATGWSGSSTPPPTARRACSGSRRSTEDVPFTKAMTAAVDREIEDLAALARPGARPAGVSRRGTRRPPVTGR